MLRSSKLTFQYPAGPAFSFPEIAIDNGQQLLILGASGTGKTTFLHLLAGLRTAQGGRIEIAGKDMAAMGESQRDRHRGRHVGIIYQTPHFIDSLSVEDNLFMPQFLSEQRIDKARAKQLLERLNIGGKLHAHPRALSTGEQQRVAIARALMHKPDVVFADEPTSALDDNNAREVMDLLEEQVLESGAALIVVTHDQRLKDRISNTVEL